MIIIIRRKGIRIRIRIRMRIQETLWQGFVAKTGDIRDPVTGTSWT